MIIMLILTRHLVDNNFKLYTFVDQDGDAGAVSGGGYDGDDGDDGDDGNDSDDDDDAEEDSDGYGGGDDDDEWVRAK